MGVSSKVRYDMGNLKVLLSWCPRLNFVVARTFSERICYSNVENETICTPLSKVIAYGTRVLMKFRIGSDVKDSFPKNHVTQWRIKKCSGVNFIHILLKLFYRYTFAKMWQKSYAKHFRMKNVHVKCWWNLPLDQKIFKLTGIFGNSIFLELPDLSFSTLSNLARQNNKYMTKVCYRNL